MAMFGSVVKEAIENTDKYKVTYAYKKE